MADLPVDARLCSGSTTVPTDQDYIAMWVDLVGACDELLRAGLRRDLGPRGDLEAAYREWQAEQWNEHRGAILRMMERFGQRGMDHGR
jgi:hypothetical protein